MTQKIPKIIHQVWIGPKPPPLKWMDTWKKFNPGWDYILWDNKRVFGRKWQNQRIIDEYVRRYNEEVKGAGEDGRDQFVSVQGTTFRGDKATYFAWHIMADIIRYEVLYEYGGYMPGADSECIRNIDFFFDCDHDLFLVNTGNMYAKLQEEIERRHGGKPEAGLDLLRWKRYDPDNCSPVMACSKGHWFVGKLVHGLTQKKLSDLGEAVDTTGNVYMGEMIKKYRPKAKVIQYQKGGAGVLSIHHAGTTQGCYRKGEYIERDLVYIIDGKSNIRYSLRSVAKNLEHRNIVIVGPKPKWAKDVIHIKCPDLARGEGKEIRNVARKLLKACKSEKVSDNFLLMNDDFYVLKPWEPEWLYLGKLREAVREAKRKQCETGYHQKAQLATLGLLGKKAVNYSVHSPCEMNKKRVLDLEKKYKFSSGKYLIRTLYGNEYYVGGEPTVDPKTKKYAEPERVLLSTIDRIEKSKAFKQFIRKRFPHKCKYEK